jgi:hypothetical protein
MPKLRHSKQEHEKDLPEKPSHRRGEVLVPSPAAAGGMYIYQPYASDQLMDAPLG